MCHKLHWGFAPGAVLVRRCNSPWIIEIQGYERMGMCPSLAWLLSPWWSIRSGTHTRLHFSGWDTFYMCFCCFSPYPFHLCLLKLVATSTNKAKHQSRTQFYLETAHALGGALVGKTMILGGDPKHVSHLNMNLNLILSLCLNPIRRLSPNLSLSLGLSLRRSWSWS